MQNYFALSSPQIVNASVDFSPVRNALEDYRIQSRQAQQDKLATENRQYERWRQAQSDQLAQVERLGKMALAYDQLTDPTQRQAGLNKILAEHPNAGSLSGAYRDPNQAFKLIAAEAGQFVDPYQKQKQQLELAATRAEIEKNNILTAKTRQEIANEEAKYNMAKSLMPDTPSTAPTLQNIGNTASTGELPTQGRARSNNPIDNMTPDEKQRAAMARINGDNKTFNEILDVVSQRMKTESGVTGTLKNLAALSDRFSGEAFENALGPMQGMEDKDWKDSTWTGYFLSPLARYGGEAINRFNNAITPVDKNTGLPVSYDKQTGGRANLNELRQEISKGVNTLSLIIKPLVKLKGDQWTNFDTDQLNRALGDLLSSKNVGEYRRRLNSTTQMLKDSYGLNIEPLLNENKSPKQLSTPSLRNEVSNINSID